MMTGALLNNGVRNRLVYAEMQGVRFEILPQICIFKNRFFLNLSICLKERQE
jgi:hypothetical protein